jgi:hypothetical protein
MPVSTPLMERNYGRPLPTTPAAPVTVLTDAEALDQVQKDKKYFWEYAEPNSVS